MAFLGGLARCRRFVQMAALSLVLGGVVNLGFESPARSSGPSPGDLIERHAPIIIDASDPSIDTTDPDLIAEMTEIHEAFEPGEKRTIVGPIIAEVPSAASVNTGMSVTFASGNPSPSNVQVVVAAAVADWDAAVASTPATPIEIAVIWTDLGNPYLLGSAGPNGLYAGSPLPSGSFYPAPLANVLLGYDVNGAAQPELTINLNSQASWYIGTTGSPSPGQVDLYSVVLHEIGHGLGFLGSGSLHNHAPNTSPSLEDTPFVFDRQVTYGGAPLVGNPSANSLLQSNSLFINLSDALSNKLYAPGSWQEGSSFSHFDESSYPAGAVGALMTPSLGSQEVERTIDAATLGVLARTGWPTRVGAATPQITSASSSSGQVTVSWQAKLNQVALAPDSYRVEARQGASVIKSTTVSGASSTATVAGLASGASYTVAVVPIVDGVAGGAATTSITVAGGPNKPRAVSVSGSGSTRTVSWLPPENTTVTSYEVQKSVNGGGWLGLGSTAGVSKAVSVGEGVYQFRVRATNSSGTSSWGYSIPMGLSPTVVRPVPLDGQLSRLYRAYFLRSPDDAGFQYWRSVRASGADLRAISEAFATSGEFATAYGSLDNAQFVDLVYQNVLGRAADAQGRAYWIGRLGAGAPRGEVMIGFSDSAEFVVRTGTAGVQSTSEAEVYRLYVAFFLRTPDAGGLDYWVGVRNSGASLEAIAAAFAASDEFQTSYGALSDSVFVDLVYNNVLARQADQTGRSYWLTLLAAGTNRGSMMTGFSESHEFVLKTGTVP